ncbi:MAG: lamin tail domain-containing protein [Polyangiales bacterium]
MRTTWALMVCAALGCSEARDPLVPDGDAGADVPATPDAAVTPDAMATPDAAVTPDAMATPDAAPGAGRLVINEIRAADEEWVEFYNAGTGAVDLSNVQVADSESDGGARVSRAMTFPAGLMLAPGQYVLLAINVSDAGAGPQTACVDGGPSTCFHANWGLSASRGETVHVLSASGAPIVAQAYPADAVDAGLSYGRLPNGTGAFAANRPTPGAPNAAP